MREACAVNRAVALAKLEVLAANGNRESVNTEERASHGDRHRVNRDAVAPSVEAQGVRNSAHSVSNEERAVQREELASLDEELASRTKELRAGTMAIRFVAWRDSLRHRGTFVTQERTN